MAPIRAAGLADPRNDAAAAATALSLAADGRISARGVFGPALRPAAPQPVYEGDRPPPDLNAMMDEVIAEARRDRAAARQLLTVLTFGCRSLRRFEDERAYLLGVGVPAEFIPGARDPGDRAVLQAAAVLDAADHQR